VSPTNFHSTSHTVHSPFKKSLGSSARKSNHEGTRKEFDEILANADSTDIFTTDRFPRPKPFFHQAYLAKSKLDTLSQVSSHSRFQKARMAGKAMKAHYPPGNMHMNGQAKFPHIKSNRFNEDESAYSSCSKKSKLKRLRSHQKLASPSGIQHFIPQNLTIK